MKITKNRHFRALRHSRIDPKKFLLKSVVVRWMILFSAILIVVKLTTGPSFRIDQISCLNQDEKECDPVVMAELNRHKGESTFLINTKDIKQKLINANPAYRDINVLAKLPKLLIVTMTDKSEYSNLKVASNSGSFIVDQNLRIVDESTKESGTIFTIIAPEAVQYGVGDQITDPTIIKSYEIARQLKKKYINFENIIITSPTMIIAVLPDGKKVLFTTTKDISRQVTSLQLILSKATITPEPREIDVRFDKPVLK